MARQVELDRRALAELAVDLGMALGLAGEAVDHREAQPRALADRLGGEEGLERLARSRPAACRVPVSVTLIAHVLPRLDVALTLAA